MLIDSVCEYDLVMWRVHVVCLVDCFDVVVDLCGSCCFTLCGLDVIGF